MEQRTTSFLCAFVCWLAACTGVIPAAGGGGDGPGNDEGPSATGGKGQGGTAGSPGAGEVLVPGGALRRLSVRELEATLDGLFPELAGKRPHFPPDSFALFDTEAAHLDSGLAFLENVAILAEEVVALAREDARVWARVRPCEDDGDRAACLASFYDEWAPRLLRRPPADAERARFVALAGLDVGGLDDTLSVALEALLRHPEFVHRVEMGQGTGETRALARHEILSRLAFFLWGQAPDDELRSESADVALDTRDARLSLARRMLQDERARRQVVEQHAQWLGYWGLPRDALGQAMWRESAALVEKVVFDEDLAYRELFLSPESYLTPALASHYGLAPLASEGWVTYGVPDRLGILGHGSFLSAFANIADTSPVKRGKGVQNRLLCRSIELPVDANVDVDVMPAEDQCRVDFLRETHAVGGCAACHKALDGVGFGLERFDRNGAPRTHESGKSDCNLDGKGELDGEPFAGPAGLARLLTDHEEFQPCVVKQVARFYLGQNPESSDEGEAWAAKLAGQLDREDFQYQDLLLAIVGADEFVKVAPGAGSFEGGRP